MIEYSVIVPVYNRPDEVKELLESLPAYSEDYRFEVILVEDGSRQKCDHLITEFAEKLRVHYHFKKNEGPGPARNYGAEKARGKWLIFLDSDVLLPGGYFTHIKKVLSNQSDLSAFGGPDSAHSGFTSVQKAISYSMTSLFTTGGIRGNSKSMERFKPRSFNMGIKKDVFDELGGFRPLRFGEDLDFSLRIEQAGLKTTLIPDAFVYHKRRTKFRQFFKQVFNSGMARIVLSELHPGTMKLVHSLPAIFTLFHCFLLVGLVLHPSPLWLLPPVLFSLLIVSDATVSNKNFWVGMLSIVASYTQLFGYGLGFLKAFWRKYILRKDIRYAFLETFYD